MVEVEYQWFGRGGFEREVVWLNMGLTGFNYKTEVGMGFGVLGLE